MSQEPIRIAIHLEGGLIHEVYTAGVPVQYVVVDYDTDGLDEDRIIQIDGEDCAATAYRAVDSCWGRAFLEEAFAKTQED